LLYIFVHSFGSNLCLRCIIGDFFKSRSKVSVRWETWVRTWVDGEWVRDLKWRRGLFVWVAELEYELMGVLIFIQISNGRDILFWKHDSTRFFFVKSAYSILERASRVEAALSALSGPVLSSKVWKFWAASKVIVFSWKLLQNKIPSR
jgi:hypothetical protein